MKSSTTTGNFGLRKALVAGLAGLIVGLGGIYLYQTQIAGSATANVCQSSMTAASQLKPLATGEVAAFLPAQNPLSVSDLTFKTADGTPISLADIEGTKLLNIWATWCAPCRKEMPHLDKLQAEMGGDVFNVIAVNVDRNDTSDKQLAFLEEVGVSHLAYYSDNSMKVFNDLRAKARALGLPTTIMVGEDGCEIGTMYGPADWAAPEALKLVNRAIEAQS
ncbi:TlpA disulfide reductase family protein [Pseudovibrio exalbescens]|uniref:thiol:disulfide interchange protein TlpA n=1 Tax=Pseudovibrio exalbescens TaxID=197461 RepID=UPI0023664B5F|nr:TlpA disulfide reductase family protein [Pseudovibrio exalbescens]MDD7909485.1 TlpA disulfide reductase family protein [Pseudovibrio exalbescens]